jgi:hypothetical protein
VLVGPRLSAQDAHSHNAPAASARSLSDGVRVAFIVENGAPIELLEFTDPNHLGRRQQSKMLIQTPSIQSTS